MGSDSNSATPATVVSNLQGWLAQPFSTQMGLKGWFAFTGLILVFTVMWLFILRDLKGEI